MDRSLLAGVNALFRAVESRRPAQRRMLSDPWAAILAERDWRVQFIRFSRFLLPPVAKMIAQLQTVHCVRHRSVDELVLRAVEQDQFRQVVVLGAGYDMRPARFAARLGGVLWIEVDHPGTQASKLLRLRPCQGTIPEPERVPADLMISDLADALGRTSFDPSAPSCFVLEGLVHYLSLERVERIFSSIGKGRAPRRVILSFIRSDMYAQAPGLFIKLVQAMREVPRLSFDTDELEALLARHGLSGFRVWRLQEQRSELAPESEGRDVGLSQDIAQADRVPPPTG